MNSLDYFKRRLADVAVQLRNWSDSDWFSAYLTTDPHHYGDLKETLECHARQFAIDLILDGLGWHGFSVPAASFQHTVNMTKEVAVRPPGRQRRWMDYLGFEGECQSPLLLVEAKRLAINLPTRGRHTGFAGRHPMVDEIRQFAERLNLGKPLEDCRANLELNSEWAQFLAEHLDYLKGLKSGTLRIPPMSVITNGEWLLTFIQPADLLTASTAITAEIRVYDSLERIQTCADEVFEDISFVRLAERPGPLRIDELSDVVDRRGVMGVTRGVEISYHENRGRQFESQPSVYATPVVGIVSHDKRIVLVAEGGVPCSAPTDAMPGEYDKLRTWSDRLLNKVSLWVGRSLPVLRLDELGLAAPHGTVRELSGSSTGRTFVYITGIEPYLLNLGQASNCDAHSRDARARWNTILPQIPATTPKVMFRDGDQRFCCHDSICVAKLRTTIVDSGRDSAKRCRSSPVCLLGPFEQYACCQTCVYLGFCGIDIGFSLPCNSTGLK